MTLIEELQQLRRESEDAFATADALNTANQQKADALLQQYADTNRRYPVGYAFIYDGEPHTIGRAWAWFHGDSVSVVYAVQQHGIDVDTLMEKNVDNPDYA